MSSPPKRIRKKKGEEATEISDYCNMSTYANETKVEEARISYFIPEFFTVRIPGTSDRMHLPPTGYQTIHTAALAAGLRFPLHPFVETLLRRLNLNITQLTPNSYRHISGFILLMQHFQQEASFENFFYLYELESKTEPEPGFYYFRPRRHHKIVRKVLHNVPTSHGKWKAEFFYLQAPESLPWRIPPEWNLECTSPTNIMPHWESDFLPTLLSKYYNSELLVTDSSLQLVARCPTLTSETTTLASIVASAELDKETIIKQKAAEKTQTVENLPDTATCKRTFVKSITRSQKKAKLRSIYSTSKDACDASKGGEGSSLPLSTVPPHCSPLQSVPTPLLAADALKSSSNEATDLYKTLESMKQGVEYLRAQDSALTAAKERYEAVYASYKELKENTQSLVDQARREGKEEGKKEAQEGYKARDAELEKRLRSLVDETCKETRI